MRRLDAKHMTLQSVLIEVFEKIIAYQAFGNGFF